MKSEIRLRVKMSHYIVINSNNNLEYFPDNKPYHFRTVFQAPLHLTGFWKMAAVEAIIAEPNAKVGYNLYLHCDACDGCILDGEYASLLRPVRSLKTGKWTQTFDLPYYVSTNKSELRELEIYIKDGKGNLATFLRKPVSVTIHFKSYPFFN